MSHEYANDTIRLLESKVYDSKCGKIFKEKLTTWLEGRVEKPEDVRQWTITEITVFVDDFDEINESFERYHSEESSTIHKDVDEAMTQLRNIMSSMRLYLGDLKRAVKRKIVLDILTSILMKALDKEIRWETYHHALNLAQGVTNGNERLSPELIEQLRLLLEAEAPENRQVDSIQNQ